MTENGAEPTVEQALEAKEEVRKEQQELMDELTEHDHITRFFKNKCFAFADEADQTAAISSLINCEDKFVEAYMVTVGKVYQESRKRVCQHYKNLQTMYLFLTAEESLLDTDGHRINNLVGFCGSMYNTLIRLRNEALTLCEAIRQIKTSQISRKIKKHFEYEFTPDQRRAYDEGTKSQEDAQSMILKGNCFRTLYESAGGEMDCSNKFANEMRDAILDLLAAYQRGVDQNNRDENFFCGITALTVYYFHHFHNYVDMSLFRKVTEAAAAIPEHRMLGEQSFSPLHFLKKECYSKMNPRMDKLAKSINHWMMIMGKGRGTVNMEKEIKDYCGYADTWKAEFLEKKKSQTESIARLSQWGLDITELFLKCVRIMENLTKNVYSLIKLKNSGRPEHEMDRASAYAILTAIETVKKLEFFVLDNWGTMEEGLFLARQQWRKQLLRILSEARKCYIASKNKNTGVIEAATKRSFYHIAEAQCVNEMIASRTVVLGLAYEIGRLETHVQNTDRKVVQQLMARLEQINSPRQLMNKACYTGLLMGHEWLPHLYFDSIVYRKPQVDSIEAFCSCLGGFVEGAKETGQSVSMITKLKKTVDLTLIEKVAAQMDMDLRILGNSNIPVGDLVKADVNNKDLEYIGYLIKVVKKFQVGTTVVYIKESLRTLLEDKWYAMEILAPNNAKIYTRMQQLAKLKYDLELLDPDLPQADADETVAILDLLQNFSHFCSNYNFFAQGYMFIEKASDSKRLHCIRMSDLKTAIRKHGVGILPTAVNSAYRIIRNKVQTFLEFLSEDTVRYQIQKYLHEMEANKSTPDAKKKPHYKVSWAATVLKNLSKQNALMGPIITMPGQKPGTSVTEDGTEVTNDDLVYTYFDRFRLLITQIGNAISMVRMLCQAARENHYDRQDLFPLIKKHMEDLESTSRGQIYTSNRSYPVNVPRMHATYRLGLVKEMFERVAEHRNYTKMMCVEFKSLMFASKLNEDKIDVLDYFHGIIPALSLSHVQYMMAHENRVKKIYAMKHNKDLVVTDDGCAAGIAFLLHIMDGWDAFFKMNWFDTYTALKEQELRTQSESREYTQSVQLKTERLTTELKILNNFKMNFGIQHTIFTMS
ncbi:hypothetical protein CAEBREN_22104 [Caenorhabditis brenneri]|uniref:Uncharacterized protein n=1 Tax=Caenorhabditis brenneri TaxID=135651 RepID=G0MQF7_CAEBE|nr:hypothetical protein CAEBREN_22104 [Caenorhabditis brenneri]